MFYWLKTPKSDSIETPIGKYDIDEYLVIGPNGGMPKHQSCKHFDMDLVTCKEVCLYFKSIDFKAG